MVKNEYLASSIFYNRKKSFAIIYNMTDLYNHNFKKCQLPHQILGIKISLQPFLIELWSFFCKQLVTDQQIKIISNVLPDFYRIFR